MATSFIITERESQSWPTWISHKTMKAIGMETLVHGPRFLRGPNAQKAQPLGSPELDIPHSRLKGCTVQHRLVHDFHVYDITPTAQPSQAPKQKKKLIYFAGGGFQSPATPPHWSFCVELCNKIPNTTAVLVSYPLSPANTADKCYKDIQKVYLALLAETKASGETAILGGDSAGGNLTLGLPTSTLKEDSNALYPAILLPISPAVEVTHDNPDIEIIEPFDPMLSKAYCKQASAQWRGQWPCSDARLSVLFADLSPLVERKIHVVGVAGKYDCLAPDIMLFIEKSKKAGLSSEWLIWDKQMHCFPLAFTLGFTEAVAAKDWIIEKLSQ